MPNRGGVKREANLIIHILDRAVHQSTSDLDVLQSINGIRRIVKTLTPSDILRPELEDDDDDDDDEVFKPEDYIRLRKDYERVLAERNGVVAENKKHVTTLRQKESLLTQQETLLAQRNAEVCKLQAQISAMRSEFESRMSVMSSAVTEPPEGKNTYTYSEVMSIIWVRFGKMNGALKSLESYNAMLREKDPSIPLINGSAVQAWRKNNAYPAWAVNQLKCLESITKGRMKWTEEHVAFLRTIYLRDPSQTDDQLARRCTEEFNFEINNNSIKSKLNVLRMKKEIPLRSRAE